MNASPTNTLPQARTPVSLALLVAACALTLATAAAVAEEADSESRSAFVRFAPPELQTDSGARAVYARIERAAKQVCGGPHRFVLRELAAMNECRADAIDGAVTKAASARLLAVHRKSTGNSGTRLAAAGTPPQH